MTARPATAQLRRLLLISLLVLTAALIGLYLFGRQGSGNEATAPVEPPPAGAREDVIASSDAFDYTQSIEGEPIFSIHGDSFSTTRDARVELHGVRIDVYRDRKRYTVASQRATYDPNTKEAVLTGGAVLEGGDGMRITSERMSLAQGGQLLVADGPVLLQQAERWRGESSRLEFDLPSDLLRLDGPLRFESAPGTAEAMTFDAERLEYDRRGRLIRIPQALSLTRGANRLQAGSGELFLAADERSPALLSLRGGVAGTIVDPGLNATGRRIAVQASRLSLRYASGGGSKPEEATLEGQRKDLALLESIGSEADLIQGLASRGWIVRFVDGAPAETESTESVYFAEYRRGVEEAVRTGRADSGRAEIGPSGEVQRIALVGGVSLTDPQFKAWGDRALFDLPTGRAEILGPKARVESARGELSAPHLVYERTTGVLTGTGGVRAVLRQESPGALAGMGWTGSEPVQVQAGEATLTDAPRGFAFRDSVRAWQGKNLLVASQLRGDDSARRLAAAGNVKTVWYPTRSGTNAGEGAPIEVTSETLFYSDLENLLVYEGSVKMQQSARQLSCAKLVAELGADRKIRRMIGTGAIQLRDPAAGRAIDGDRAEYDVASGSVLIAGDLVTMKDADGALLKGKRLLYDLNTGAAKLLGAES